MGFFFVNQKRAKKTADLTVGGYSLEMLHKSQCSVCPLNSPQYCKSLANPHMDANGSRNPVVYMLGQAPTQIDDRRGIPFSGPVGKLVRERIPQEWRKHVRFNNCIRTRPPKDREPGRIELECCRPSVEADIEETKPDVIFGFGGIPLKWALNRTHITRWRGRKIPIKVGDHHCWFFPMIDPLFVSQTRRFTPRSLDKYGSDYEFAFAHDLRTAFRLIPDLPDPIIHTKEQALSNIEIIRNVDQLEAELLRLYDEKVVGFDYETTRLRPYNEDASILTTAITGKEKTIAFPLDHPGSGWSPRDRKRAWSALERFIYEAPCRRVAHHLSFEQEWTAAKFGDESLRAQPWEDTESQAYILDARRGMLSLDVLCQIHFGINLKDISGDLDTKRLIDMPVDQVLTYNGLDAKYHRGLYFRLMAELKAQKLVGVYEEQLRRVPTMVLTQIQGVPTDAEETEYLAKRYDGRLKKIEKEIVEHPDAIRFAKMKGHQYRPAAHQDVTFLCKKILKKQIESTNEATISQIDHPLIGLTLRWRKASKLRSTYVTPMQKGSPVLFDDGMLHPILSVTSTVTWRTASEEPNIQNWPKRQKEAKEVRRQIAAKPGYKIVSIDYAGIQARNVAMESLDKALIKAFWNNYDIHSDWRERIIRIYPEWIKEGWKTLKTDSDLAKKYRHESKNKLVFPSFFGAQPKTIAAGLNVPVNIAERLHEEFWDEFPEIKGWHETLTKNYYRLGYVTGLSKFRRYAPCSPNELINSPIQSDEAIIVCDGMARLSETGDPLLQACLEVHDDLTFHWPTKKVDELSEIVIDTLLDVPYEWAKVVPMGVEISIGDNWGEMTEIGAYSSDTWKGKIKKP